MKIQVKVQHLFFLKALLLALLLASAPAGSARPPVVGTVTCIIEGLQRTGSAPGSVSYSWDGVSGATHYEVFYVRLSDNYVSPVQTISGTSKTFTGLQSGVAYRFYFAAVCGNEPPAYIGDDWIIM